MKTKLINILGYVILVGILVKLSYVFVFLFGKLDNDSLVSKITGITFACASIYFVVKVHKKTLKLLMVMLDVLTILYYYLHRRLNLPIEYSSIIMALYSGLVVYYVGNIFAAGIRETDANEKLKTDNARLSERIRELESRQRTDSERQRLEAERTRIERRLRDNTSEETRKQNEQKLNELNKKIEML